MSKKGLGRGLGALIPSLGSNVKATVLDVPVDEIKANPNQPRKNFEQESLKEMVDSIKEFGIIQPIVVRKVDNNYEIIAGERRWRASKEAGLDTIPAIVKDADNKDSLQIAIIENIQRENLNAVDEAKAYHHLISEYHMTQAELATKIGKSRTAITNTLRLLSLPEQLKSMIVSGKISSGHARALLSLPDQKAQIIMARRICDENLSVRDVESYAKDGQLEKEDSSAPKADAARERAINMKELAKELSKALATKVSVKALGSKGQIKIVFSTLDELSRIIRIMQKAD